MTIGLSRFTPVVTSLLLICLAPAWGAAQNCAVTFSPVLASTGKLIRNVAVELASDDDSEIEYDSSFKNGLAHFKSLPIGTYFFWLKKEGHKITHGTVKISCASGKRSVFKSIKMWQGSSDDSVSVGGPPPKEVRLDRITKLGSVDTDSSPARVVQSGEPYRAGNYEGGGVLNGTAVDLPKPAYPPAAIAVKAGGAVSVQVLIDEQGSVISATAVSGHPLLRSAAEAAARQAKFAPTLLSGQPVKVSGIIVYKFVP